MRKYTLVNKASGEEIEAASSEAGVQGYFLPPQNVASLSGPMSAVRTKRTINLGTQSMPHLST